MIGRGNVKTVVREAATKEITEEQNKGYVVIKYVPTIQLGKRIVVIWERCYSFPPPTLSI